MTRVNRPVARPKVREGLATRVGAFGAAPDFAIERIW
jgi:hypothetical protein